MTFSSASLRAVLGAAIVAASLMPAVGRAEAGETRSIESVKNGSEPGADQPRLVRGGDGSREWSAESTVSVAVTVLDLTALSPASFGDLDEPTP